MDCKINGIKKYLLKKNKIMVYANIKDTNQSYYLIH